MANQNWQQLFSEMLDGCALHEIILDESGRPVNYRFLAVNPAFERLTGLAGKDIVGKTVLEVLPATEAAWIARYGQVALTGEPARFQSYTQGLGKHFEVCAFRNAPQQFVCIFQDITAQRRAMDALRVIAESGTASSEDIFHLLVRELAQAQDMRYAMIARIDAHDPGTAHTVAVWTGAGFCENFSYALAGSPCADVIQHGVFFCSCSTPLAFPADHPLAGCAAKRFWGIALHDSRGQLLGVLAVFDDRDFAEQPHARTLLASFATRATSEIERMRALEQLSLSEERFGSLFANMLNGFAYCQIHNDPGTKLDFTYLQVNRAFEKLTGLHDVVGKRISTLIPGMQSADYELFERYNQVASTGTPDSFEIHLESLDMWCAVSVYCPQRGFFVAIFDVITERKRAESALRESEQRYRALIESSQEPIGILQDLSLVYGNQALLQLLGYADYAELQPLHIVDTVACEDRQAARDAYDLIISAEQPSGPFEIRLLRKDGSLVWVEVFGELCDYAGHAAVQISLHNIHARKLAEETLRRSEEFMRAVLDSSPLGISVRSSTGELLQYNAAWQKIWAMSDEDIIQDLTRPRQNLTLDNRDDYAKPWWEQIERVYKAGGTLFIPEAKTRHRRSGMAEWVSQYFYAIPDTTGQVDRVVVLTQDVTWRKKAEERLKENAEWLRLAQEAAQAGTWEWDLRTNENTWSEELWRLYGLEPYATEATYAIWLQAIQPADRGRIEAELSTAVGLGLEVSLEWRVNLPRGPERWLMSRGQPQRDEHGAVVRYIGIVMDITPLKQAEANLRENETRYRALFYEATTGILVADAADGKIIDCNDALLGILGCSREELLGRAQSELIAPAAIVGLPPARNAVQPQPVSKDVRRVRLTLGSGTEKYCEIKTGMVQANGRRVLQTFLRDITAEHHYQAEREATVRLLNLLTGKNNKHELIQTLTAFLQNWSGCESVGIRLREGDDFPYFETRGFPQYFVELENSLCVRDLQGQILCDEIGNPILECICGNVLCGRFDPALPFFTGKGSFWSNSTTKLLANSSEADRQARTRNRCNAEGYESVALIPLRAGTETLGLLQLNDHRTERFTPELIAFIERAADQIAVALSQRASQEALRESEKRLKRAQQMAHIGHWTWDLRTDKLEWSDELYRIWGREPGGGAEDLQHIIASAVHPDDVDIVHSMVDDVIYIGLTQEAEYRVIWPDGSVHYLATVPGDAIRDEAGKILVLSGVMQDVTERRLAEQQRASLEEQLFQSQKIEAIGTLAGGIAHDFNNLLFAIMGYGELVRDNLDAASPDHANLTALLAAGNRAKGLVQQILAFSRRTHAEPIAMDLDLAIQEVVKLVRATVPATIEIKTRLELNGAVVLADPTEIHQVLMNLCTNAAHAIGAQPGVLEINTDAAEIGTGFSLAGFTLEPGKYAQLHVRDSGTGMADEIKERIFEPFFTTKEQGKGTGLGLSVAYGIVSKLNGAIKVDSEPGAGSCFTVYLPLARESHILASTVTEPSPQGSARILVVDDEPDLTKVICSLLEHLGYTATSCTSGTAAWDLFQQDPERFDALLTDQTMPHLTGMELALRAHQLRPNLPILLCTGYSEAATPEQVQQHGISVCLHKPIRKAELATALQRALHSE